MIGIHAVKGWSKTQTLIALSSGESELYAASEGLGLQAIARDLGMKVEGVIWCDASAALGIIKRLGLRKVRHIDCSYFTYNKYTRKEQRRLGRFFGRRTWRIYALKH